MTTYEELPIELKYIEFIKEVEVPIKIVSGPDRKQTILNKIKNALKFQGVFFSIKPLLPYKKYLNERSTNKIKQTDLLSDNHYILNKVTFDYQKNDDSWITQKREVYDREMDLQYYFTTQNKKQSF
jgi:hypothetical protein